MNLKNKTLSGFIKRHPDGFGFFIPDDKEHPDVYVPQNAMKSAMTNDRVTLAVEKERDGRFRGVIIDITERSQKRVAGKFYKQSERWGFIKDEGRGWGQDLKIPMDQSMNAKEGELVEARIVMFPDQGPFEGEVVQVIGDAKDPLNDIKRVVITQNIPDHFSAATLEEAKHFNSNPVEKDFVNRKDLRHLPIITIDGATAKDFDDAILTEMTSDGFHLYVAIADVSHYVKPKTSMDQEAYERGNSVYFPNFVIPMLPEAISNGLCSLMPNVPRLALVADMTFDFNGEMKTTQFYEGVIQSKARVTYGEAQELLDGAAGKSSINVEVAKKLDHVKENIFKSADLAKVLMAKRFKEGSLDLEVPETELVIDGSGEPVDIIKSERLFAHRLIEEMMLSANVAVAKFFAQKEIAAIYRVHEEPGEEKIELLQRYMQNMGSQASLGGGKLQKRLTRMLQEFEGKPEAQIIHILTLRSMSQAKYTQTNLGHFGLGFDFYTHFTSPIRRYPDLIVHRLIKSQILKNGQYHLIPEEDLATAGTWLSATEQKAAKAERQIQAIKKARFMQKMVGDTFEGIISSVTKFGVFVLLRQFNIDGLIRLDDLGKEKFEFDEENLTLSAKRSGFSYTMGDPLNVTVSLVDIEQGQINFVLDKNSMQKTERSVNARPASKRPSDGSVRNNEPRAPQAQAKGGRGRSRSSGREEPREESNENSRRPSRGGNRSGRDEKSAQGGKKSFKKSSSGSTFNKEKEPARFEKKPGSGYTKSEPRLIPPEKKSFIRSLFSKSVPDEITAKPVATGSAYEPKPRYSSLSDYLDQKKKGSPNEEKSVAKPAFKSAENRKNSEKRRSPSDDSGGVRKARPNKSRRTNKSR
ncbi:MAG: ribonuclease R [Bdellovibrionaceae bacterium]|nr:ribonuclease R [Bdellovibrio sp.]